MPTGYTSIIEDKEDVTLRDYILRCSKAFFHSGESVDDPPPRKIDGSAAKLDKLNAAHKRLTTLLEMPEKEKIALGASIVKESAEEKNSFIERSQTTQSKYTKMREQVEAWDAPEPLSALKTFMLEQIGIGGPGCSNYSWYTVPSSPLEAWEMKVVSAKKDVEYATEELLTEMKRSRESNEWLNVLWGEVDQLEDNN